MQQRSNSLGSILYNATYNITFVALKWTGICFVKYVNNFKLYITSHSFLGPRNIFQRNTDYNDFFRMLFESRFCNTVIRAQRPGLHNDIALEGKKVRHKQPKRQSASYRKSHKTAPRIAH